MPSVSTWRTSFRFLGCEFGPAILFQRELSCHRVGLEPPRPNRVRGSKPETAMLDLYGEHTGLFAILLPVGIRGSGRYRRVDQCLEVGQAFNWNADANCRAAHGHELSPAGPKGRRLRWRPPAAIAGAMEFGQRVQWRSMRPQSLGEGLPRRPLRGRNWRLACAAFRALRIYTVRPPRLAAATRRFPASSRLAPCLTLSLGSLRRIFRTDSGTGIPVHMPLARQSTAKRQRK